MIDLIKTLFHKLTDVERMIEVGGYVGLAAIVFAETGLMIGFFLPGDSLLVAAGIFCARGDLDLLTVNLLLIASAIAGDATGYAIGRRLGKALFARPSSRWFNRRHLIRTQLFYERHGGTTIILARFLPILRTFAPVVAGIARMTYRRFAMFNVVGGIGWVVSMTLTGYGLGLVFPALAKRIELLMLVIIAISLLPAAISSLRAGRAMRKSRTSFLESIAELVSKLGAAAEWDGSETGLQQLVEELPAPEGGARVVDGGRPAVELVAAQSPPLAELTEAGGEVAGWQLEERFTQARQALCNAFGEPRESVTPAPVAGAPPERTATWSTPAGSLTLAHYCADRHRLTVRVEPAAQPGVASRAGARG